MILEFLTNFISLQRPSDCAKKCGKNIHRIICNVLNIHKSKFGGVKKFNPYNNGFA